MFNYVWPLALVVLSNLFYQICAKSIPAGMNAFASLTITYTVAAVTSLIMFFVVNKGNSTLIAEYQKTNWVPFVLGMAIVGLEIGFIYMYKAGWPVSTAQVVQAALLAIILVFVGYVVFKEGITVKKIAGIFVCLGGLALINLK